jgi:UDP-N-acetylglucosamine enolpyruvyl transferase
MLQQNRNQRFGDFLNSCGAKVHGAGTNVIRVEGVAALTGVNMKSFPTALKPELF